jgi:predicted transposase YdaD
MQAVVHAARTITQRVSDTVVRADLLTTLYVFGKLAYPQVDALQLIGREKMKESKAYEEIMTEGRTEGRLEVKRADVYEAIRLRYGQKAAAEFEHIIRAANDLEQLSKVLRLAIRGRPLAELRRAAAAMVSEH